MPRGFKPAVRMLRKAGWGGVEAQSSLAAVRQHLDSMEGLRSGSCARGHRRARDEGTRGRGDEEAEGGRWELAREDSRSPSESDGETVPTGALLRSG